MSFTAVTAYDRYLARAIAIAGGAPYFKSIDNEDYARLSVEGADATLSWLDISSGYYGGVETDKMSFSFPAKLLAMSDEDFAAWKKDEQAKYDQAQAEGRRNAAARQAAEKQAAVDAYLTHGVLLDGKRYRLVPQD